MDLEPGDTRTTLPLVSAADTVSATEAASAPAAAHADGTACTCGEENDKHVVLDGRLIPHAIRHATIFGALDSLEAGATLTLIVDHRPMPLLAQLEARSPEAFSTEFILEEPREVAVRFTRL
ncbi:MAG TPA: DUF2249 domain-containing protein [Microbacteriaceae bacterium]